MADPTQPSERHAWHGARRHSAGGRSDAKQARLRQIAIIAAVMLVLAGAITALLFYLRDPPLPALAVLRIDQYRDPRIPFSPWATQDREALRQLGLPNKNTFTSQEKELLKQTLQNLGHDQSPKQPLVIYLCAYAAVQDDGTVAILPADAKLDSPATWLPVKEVLALLQQCPVKRRLLLLDLALPCVEPQAGLLAINVPERLKPVLETAVKDDKDLQILAACSPGQTSLASEELGHTVFAHYIIQGLAGRADGFPNKTPDTRVTVRELVDYVTMQVDRWAYHNTGLRQTPEFFGSTATDADYELTGTDGKAVPEAAPLPGEYPAFLMDGWTERDQWWKDRVRTPPEQIMSLENTLIHADARWRKGDEAATVESDLKSKLRDLQGKRRATIGPPDSSEPRSLAEAMARGQKTPEGSMIETLRQLRELGDQWALVKQPKPNEKPSEMAVERLTKKMQEYAKKFDGKPFDFAWTIFAAALKDSDLRSEYVRCWCELLRPESKPPPLYAEIQYLKKVAAIPAMKPDEWPPAASDALHVAALAEQVETLKPRDQPWLKTEYAEVKKNRQAAEDLLFAPTVAERLQASAPMKKVRSDYNDLLTHLVTLRDAQRTCDEVQVFLPGYTAYPPLEDEQSSLDIWLEAVQNERALQEMLSKTPDANQLLSRLSEVSQKASALRNSMTKLREPLDAALAFGPIGDSRPPRAADAMEMRALLRLPGLSAAQRQTIWANARALAGKLNAETVGRETVTDTLPPPDDARAVRQELDRAQQRAWISQGLLRLAGSKDVDKVEAARKRVEHAPQEETAWQALRLELRQAWKRQESQPSRP